MDFHSFTRTELQALCKKNKIPANKTNVAMADALKALETVEGIEEFVRPSESETVQSSIESPEKMVITSPVVPRTGCRTSTRRKVVKEEPEVSQTLTRTRRGTRRRIAGEVEEAKNDVPDTAAAQTSRRRSPAASARKKLETQLKEHQQGEEKNGDDVVEERKDVLETPVAVPNGRRRGTAVSARRKVASQLQEERNDVPETLVQQTSRRRAPAGSAQRKMEIQLNEREEGEENNGDEVVQENKDALETPVAVQSGRRRGTAVSSRRKVASQLKEEKNDKKEDLEDGVIKRVYNTRQSVRLSEKRKMVEAHLKEKKEVEPIMINSISNEENLELLSSEGSNDPLEISDKNGMSGGDDLEEAKSEVVHENSNELDVVCNEILDGVLDLDVESEVLDNKGDGDNLDTKPELVFETEKCYESNVSCENLDNMENEILEMENDNVEEKVLDGKSSDHVLPHAPENLNENEENFIANKDVGSEDLYDVKIDVLENEVDALPSETQNMNENGEELNCHTYMDFEDLYDVHVKSEFAEPNDVDDFISSSENLHELPNLESREELNDGQDVESEESASESVCSKVEGIVAIESSMFQEIDDAFDEEPVLKDLASEEVGEEAELNVLNLKLSVSAAVCDTNQDIGSPNLVRDEADEKMVKDQHTRSLQEESYAIQDLGSELPIEEESRSNVFSYATESMSLVNVLDDDEVEPAPVENTTPTKEDTDQLPVKDSDHVGKQALSENVAIHKYALSMEKTPVKEGSSLRLSSLHSPLVSNVQDKTDKVSTLAADPFQGQVPFHLVELDSDHIAVPTRLTPEKKSASQTPTTVGKMTHPSDNKENIDQRDQKLDIAKENKKDIAENDNPKLLDDASLRQLRKMYKEKLQVKNNNNWYSDQAAKVMRPALQLLTENRLAAREFPREN